MSINIMDDPKCLFKSTVISELKGLKQKSRKYCKDCGGYGHSNMIMRSNQKGVLVQKKVYHTTS